MNGITAATQGYVNSPELRYTATGTAVLRGLPSPGRAGLGA
jgi:hypothetical protein